MQLKAKLYATAGTLALAGAIALSLIGVRQDRQALPELREPQALQVPLVPPEMQELQGLPVQQVPRALQVRLAHLPLALMVWTLSQSTLQAVRQLQLRVLPITLT